MILSKIWERYFFRELLKVFFLFLFGFYFLYAVLDYSAHMQDFIKDRHIQFSDLCLYYLYQFIKRADLLLPLALLVSTIKVLCTFNARSELVAFQTAGLPLKTLLRPFFLLAAVCTLFNYVNFEFLAPKSLTFLDQFHDAHFKHSHRGKRKEPFHALYLKDGSKLVYQTYDATKDAFFDVLWIRSSDDIWRIKHLKADPNQPLAEHVDHLVRTKDGFFEKAESFDSQLLTQLKWQRDMTRNQFVPFENRSLSALYRLYFRKDSTSSYDGAQILTHFNFKLAMPLLSLLVVVACAPFCVRYSRKTSVFFIYALALFGFLAFFTLMDAAVILGENHVTSPLIAIFAPFALCSGAFIWKFAKG
jgi:lipopolysaccharide export system permease protein